MQVANLFSSNQVFQVASNKKSTTKGKNQQAESLGYDTVSISEEALLASQAFQEKLQVQQATKANQKENEAKLTKFFNGTHTSSNFAISVAGSIGSGEILPENKILKDKIEDQINKLCDEENVGPYSLPSPETSEKLDHLRQKANAIIALGDTKVLSDEDLEKSASFLQSLENTSAKERSELDTSLKGQFSKAVKNMFYPRTDSEEEIRKRQEKIKNKMTETKESIV